MVQPAEVTGYSTPSTEDVGGLPIASKLQGLGFRVFGFKGFGVRAIPN